MEYTTSRCFEDAPVVEKYPLHHYFAYFILGIAIFQGISHCSSPNASTWAILEGKKKLKVLRIE